MRARDFAAWRQLSPVEAVRRSFAAIAEWADPALFITLRPESEVLAEAEKLAAAGPAGRPLFGLPFVVKDNIDVAGLPTSAACPAFAYRPAASAFVVERLAAAGAIVLGKVNLDQFATGLVGTRSPYGTPRNALRPDLIPGGSSSGSATAVATGIAAFALATDTAGSGRLPAGLNGIVGLKPSLGRLSGSGMVPACRTLDTIAIFAGSVEDAAAATAVAEGFDPADPWSRPFPPLAFAPVPPAFRVGVPLPEQRQFFGDELAAGAYERDLARLAALGATLEAIDFEPFFATARLLYEGPWVAERFAAARPLIEANPDALHPVTRSIIEGARRFSAVDAFEAQYRLMALRRETAPIVASVDALAVPTVPAFYRVEQVMADPLRLNANLGTYTNFVNLLDLAAITLPVGMRSDGLPSSLTLIGSRGSDGRLAGLARALETGERGTASPPEGHVTLAVIGAHMSGLALNPQLIDLVALFLRAFETAPDYRLYALPETSPPRPGLLRVPTGTGARIAGELWALPPEAFGRFVAAVPQPLSIGTLAFADGSHSKGFLVEAEAVTQARDISAFGSWRAFLAARP